MSGLGKLDSFPRTKLARTPTPLEEMPALTKELAGPSLYVKRDDMTGLAFGGNKARQLEFYFGAAQAEGADVALITGAVQSNFVRSAAAAAAKLGMDCHAQLEERVPDPDSTHRNSGNVLLNKLLGATIYSYDEGEDEAGADRRINEIAVELKTQGRTPYIIPLLPGHPPLGALGYVVAAQEILFDLKQQNLEINEIVVASGSTTTQAGLLFGLRALGSDIPVLGVCVRRSSEFQTPRVFDRCQDIAELLEADMPVKADDVVTMDDVLAPGYGQLNPMALEALRLTASKEGLILDPVYTGKVMAGIIHRIRKGVYAEDDNVLFIHTGGHPALFAYEPEITKALDNGV
ncbi:MAG TPA: D-cysteine desulfhydrase family protein [Rhodospirillales bacterium]|nr:D-cysteine desulfhydrase family protein [Rhodospirillales bacterium]